MAKFPQVSWVKKKAIFLIGVEEYNMHFSRTQNWSMAVKSPREMV